MLSECQMAQTALHLFYLQRAGCRNEQQLKGRKVTVWILIRYKKVKYLTYLTFDHIKNHINIDWMGSFKPTS